MSSSYQGDWNSIAAAVSTKNWLYEKDSRLIELVLVDAQHFPVATRGLADANG